MESARNFKDLEVWRIGIRLVKSIYHIAGDLPRKEQFNLSSQMNRSAVSIPSNIAEGFKRRHKQEFKQFLNITLGSLAELETQLIIASELNYTRKSPSAIT